MSTQASSAAETAPSASSAPLSPPPPLRVDLAVSGAPRESLRLAEAADRGSIDRVQATETAHDPFLLLAAAAQHTARVELGTGVAIAFARTPMTVAQSAWDLQTLSEGRAVIGLGSQVRAHVTRRFGMQWSRPAARMREFVLAVRAIWQTWQDGAPLDFQGEFYSHTLMPPPFNPGPLPEGAPPVLVAAVGPGMARTAGEVGDGIICHPFATVDHLRGRVLSNALEARRAAESREAAWTARPFEVCGGVFAAVGRTEQELQEAITGVRERIAFYGSTPGYQAVLDDLGLHDLHTELHALSRQNQWRQMGRLIDDDVLTTFAIVGTPAEAARAIDARYRGVLDRVSLALARTADPYTAYETLAEIKALSGEGSAP